ncbi:MAG: cocE [Mycobacterium sp.]|nr:cocE [Mycobacterium sp.]
MTAISERTIGPAFRKRLGLTAGVALSRLTGTPPPQTTYQVHRGVRIPMRDGVDLLADHYVPDVEHPVGTVLVRGPYGRRRPFSALYASVYATRGYHVVFQSVRGTFGSGGVFDPTVNEAADGADTAAWLRDQPWFTGTFGTIGLSYLGATQWALLQDPPPELTAAVIVVGPHDFAATTWGTGSFAVNDFLGWSNMVSHQEDPGVVRAVLRQLRSRRVVAQAAAQLPLGAAGRALLGSGAPWWESWVGHPDPEDTFWDRYRWPRALSEAQVPVLLIGGWQDLFIEQTFEQYRALRDRGVEVALTVGPWTHTHMMSKAAPHVLRESLRWLGTHLAGRPAPARSRVRAKVTGGGGWLELPDWPPTTTESVRYLDGPARLTETPATSGQSRFTFDPQDPTPTIGGRLLSPGSGRRRDDALAHRHDVLTFTGDALPDDLYVYGTPVLELAHESDTPYVDRSVRLSEVDVRGHSRNVSDGYVRLRPDRNTGPVRVELDPVAHRFAAGARLRLLIGGGSFPRYARNLGTGDSVLEGAQTVPATHLVTHAGSRLVLPVGEPS